MTGTGIVVAVKGEMAKVKISISECEGCHAKKHCKGEEAPKSKEIMVINEYGAKIADYVVFESNTLHSILSATLIWILPLVFMILGYFIIEHYYKGVLPVLGAFLFFGISFLIIKALDSSIAGGKTFYPKIIRIIESDKYTNS